MATAANPHCTNKTWTDSNSAFHQWQREWWNQALIEPDLAREWGTVFGERVSHRVDQHAAGTAELQIKEQQMVVKYMPSTLKVRWKTNLKRVTFGPPGSNASEGITTVDETWNNEHEFGIAAWTPHLEPAPSTPAHSLRQITAAPADPTISVPPTPGPSRLLASSYSSCDPLQQHRRSTTQPSQRRPRDVRASSLLETLDEMGSDERGETLFGSELDDNGNDEENDDENEGDLDDVEAAEEELQRQLRAVRRRKQELHSRTEGGSGKGRGNGSRSGSGHQRGKGKRRARGSSDSF